MTEPNRNDALINAYRLSLRHRNLAPTTITRRRRIITNLARQHDLVTITPEEIEDWIQGCAGRDGRGVVARSRNAYLADFKSFYDWVVKKGHRGDNPVLELERSRVPRLLPRPMASTDLERALAEATPRMRLWLCLVAYAGLRCCEIAALAAEDLVWHTDPPEIIVQHGKGGHQRKVPMASAVEDALREADLPRAGFLFRSKVGRDHVTAQSVSQVIGRYLRAHGINATAHMGRHHFGTLVYEATDGDIRTTQELLGHVSPTTTAIYAAWSPGRAAQVVRGFGARP